MGTDEQRVEGPAVADDDAVTDQRAIAGIVRTDAIGALGDAVQLIGLTGASAMV